MSTINKATIVDITQDPGLNYLSGSAVATVQQRQVNGLPTGNVIFNNVTEVRNVYVKQNNPGGSVEGELQFKNGSAFGGDAELKYNPNTNRLELDGSMVVGNIYADNFFFANNQNITDVFSQGGGSSDTNIDEYGNFYTSNFFASGAGLTGYGGAVFIRTSRPDAGSTLDFEFNENGQFKLPPGGDIVDSTGTSVLGSNSTSADTGNITFSNTTLVSTGNVVITFDLVASPAVAFSFTESGEFNAPAINTSSIDVAGAKHSTTQSTECLPNVDTIVFTGSAYGTGTLKALFHVEGVETVDLESQSCEMMVAVMPPRVAGSVYGLAYTSTGPLATFAARWNSISQLVEITCRPTSTTETVHVQTTTIELSILAP